MVLLTISARSESAAIVNKGRCPYLNKRGYYSRNLASTALTICDCYLFPPPPPPQKKKKKCRKDYFSPIFAILSNNNNQEHSDHHDEGEDISDHLTVTVKSVCPDTTRGLPPATTMTSGVSRLSPATTMTSGVSSLPPATTVQPELPPAVLNLHNNCDESEQESRVESADVSNYCSFSPETPKMQISSEPYRIPPEAYDAVSKVRQHPFCHPPRSIPGQVHMLANPLLHSTMKGKWPFMLYLLKGPCSNTWAIFLSLLCLLLPGMPMSPPQVPSPIKICLILKAVPLFRTLLLCCYSYCWQLCVLCSLS